MKVWITKYATTEGIIAVDDAEDLGGKTQKISVKSLGEHVMFHGEGKEWHRTQTEAIAHAEQMREKAIASHRKAIDKLEKLRF